MSTTTTPSAPTVTGLRFSSASSGTSSGERSNAENQVLDRGDIDAGLTSVPEQQWRDVELADGLPRVVVGHRCKPYGSVVEQFRRGAAEPDEHQWAVRLDVADADEQLDDRRDHRLHDGSCKGFATSCGHGGGPATPPRRRARRAGFGSGCHR
jgi:hypothetical protein